MHLDLGPLAKLGGHPKKGPQMMAGVPRRDEGKFAGPGGDVEDLKRAEGCVHRYDCLGVQPDPCSALIRSWTEAQ
jgi:hypothetical protein